MAASTNEITVRKFSAWTILVRQFKNPLLLVFIISTIVAYLIGEKSEALVIWAVMSISIILGFWNEYQAERIVNDLIKRISFTASIVRDGVKKMIPVREIVVGDEVSVHPGSIIPADISLVSSENLEVNESVLTGESAPVIKKDGDTIYMGTVVSGGNAHGKVIAIGTDTKYGKISELAEKARPLTEFQKGLRDFSLLLTKIAGVTVFFVIVLGYFLHHPVIETVLFALTVAMGITPELLPLIVTLGLSYGARKMAKEDVIVKQFVAIEDLGNMEVLCTDKTGTLTEGKISLTTYENIKGEKDDKILSLGLICNSGFLHKHALSDSMDKAIMDFAENNNFEIKGKHEEIFHMPFSYESRFMASVIKEDGRVLVVCKGSPEIIISRTKATDVEKKKFEKIVTKLQNEGIRVIAIATKEISAFNSKLIKSEFRDLTLSGYLGFADIPKEGLKETFDKFEKLGVKIKIITGDNEVVAEKVSRDVGFLYKKVLTNPEIEKMNEEELGKVVWDTDIFARVTPSQKVRIILALKRGGHTVGYMGDGINDGPALHNADVGISVNSGVDVAKDAAQIILLRKSIGVVADGIRVGRKTFQNTIKYILMGTSSDFGNMVSAAAASVVLPFLPMTPVQFLLNDILYDVSQTSIPGDNVDADQLLRPKSWDLAYIKRFMILFGTISTVYDFLTFGVMYFVFHARGSLFQTGWFVVSLITEVLVVFVIRTTKIPFWRSAPSFSFLLTCLGVVALGLYLPFSPLSNYFGFTPLPVIYFGFLMGITLTYLVFVEIGKYYLNKGRFN
ncbi:MAG TPA: magnesium-translocating P-type ATPase [Patescibacteria group bacterium]|nr:magnesium-translocating P-type ATPase [Patescibacteria group bacterium]